MNNHLRVVGEPADHYLSDAQVAVLLSPIRPHRVSKDGKGFSHVEAYEIRAHLIRMFGFARWSEEVTSQELVFESFGAEDDPNPKARGKWTVCYRSLVRLTIFGPTGVELAVYTEGATGDASNQPSRSDAHDLALKTSQSQAFKRCAMNLGDQFGLCLYNNGKLEPLVKSIVGWAPPETAPAAPDAHITHLAPEDAPGPDTSAREMSPPSPQGPAVVARAQRETPAPTPDPAGGADADGSDGAPSVDQDGAVEHAALDGTPGEDTPLSLIMASVAAARLQSPAEATQTLTQCMTLAAKTRLGKEMVPGHSPPTTLQAYLLNNMRQAADALRSVKAGA